MIYSATQLRVLIKLTSYEPTIALLANYSINNAADITRTLTGGESRFRIYSDFDRLRSIMIIDFCTNRKLTGLYEFVLDCTVNNALFRTISENAV